MKTTIKFPENLISTQINSTKVAMMCSIIVVTLMLFISTVLIDFDSHQTLSSMMICAGIFGVIASGLISLSLKHEVLTATHSPLVCRSIEFKESAYDDVLEAATENRWTAVEFISKDSVGGVMKIELVYSTDKSFAAYQVFKYVPHNFESCSDILYINKEHISHIGKS